MLLIKWVCQVKEGFLKSTVLLENKNVSVNINQLWLEIFKTWFWSNSTTVLAVTSNMKSEVLPKTVFFSNPELEQGDVWNHGKKNIFKHKLVASQSCS